ncbi:MAG TPA: hypothetical protein VKU60_09850, partial [Chloroflexota bacterium]|nr:hypothetical protein [Chloroflexota bacterium]
MLTRRQLGVALGGAIFILLLLGLHAFIQRQLQAVAAVPAATATAAPPAAVPGSPTAVPSLAPSAVPTIQATPSPVQTPKPTTPPQPTNTPAPPPTFTPTPGPIVTNDKLGVGVYTNGIPINVLQTLRPAMILVQDPSPQAVGTLRFWFPKALIVGRHFVPDGDPSLARCTDAGEDHHAKGVQFADTVARTALQMKDVVNAWVGDNEQANNRDPAQLTCHAQFQTGFVEELQGKYGIAAVAGNDAAGALEPADYPKYFAKPISEAVYFGVHAYSKPEARTMETGDAQFYALRYRLIHDALVQAGVPLPKGGFLLTETGLYEGWRGFISDQDMASQFTWLDQETEKDDYLKGQFIFGIGPQTRFGNFEIAG